MKKDDKSRRPAASGRPDVKNASNTGRGTAARKPSGQKRTAGSGAPGRAQPSRGAQAPGRQTAYRDTAAAGKKVPKKKKRRRISRFHMAVAVVVALLLVAGAVTAFLLLAPRTPVPGAEDGRKTAVFGVSNITVEGDTRYSSEDIIEKSGVFIGQSVFSVNKKKAAEEVLEAFPYIEKVAVDSPSFDHVRISVTEVTLLGALSTEEGFLMIGANNKLVERLAPGEMPPEGLMMLQGRIASTVVGEQALEERSYAAALKLLESVRQNEMEGIVGLDVTDSSNLQLNWKNQITILLGSDVNLDYEMGVAEIGRAHV